ncbi:MAG: M20/M25/M40 family metallo-hydrolase [Clostridia bacterium]|nr:M20/M25/M40 family metallo-hydrolase [Clostridiales bacterium]MBQ3232927.1 M20/M25/M40 family metallo-hydrolase [Clostridia bacterium]
MPLTNIENKWILEHIQEAESLLKTLGKIPAPSHHEEKRALFIRDWFISAGADDIYIDEAKNVILKIGNTEEGPVSVVMAHTDIVFGDTDDLPMREENGRLYAPGIGDDTGNLVALMMAAKYMLLENIVPKGGLIIAANACEEGLGNLKGVKQILKDYEGQIQSLVSLDCNLGEIVNNAVGSCRVKITVHAKGGHSYSDFGNENAIVQMARLITRLYEKTPPTGAKTTYNAGVIEGGSTVNSIAGECSLLYEYRSESRECMQEMDAYLNETIDSFRNQGMNIETEVIGIRPCKGDVDEEKQNKLTKKAQELIYSVTHAPASLHAASTDANASLALGIPSVTIGAVVGGGAHTRDEWIELGCLKNAMAVAIGALKWCTD